MDFRNAPGSDKPICFSNPSMKKLLAEFCEFPIDADTFPIYWME
jgi:hypothetical protein